MGKRFVTCNGKFIKCNQGICVIPGSEITPDYLCFTANEAEASVSMNELGAPTLNQNFEYSLDKTNWNTFVPNETIITLSNVGDKVYFRGNNPNGISEMDDEGETAVYQFSIDGSIAASGNIMTLIDRIGQTLSIPNNGCFTAMFYDCWSLTTAPKLPATNLTSACYSRMFGMCEALTYPPELPATTLDEYCYKAMFYECTSLTTAPSLPATTLAKNCYKDMFLACMALTTVPKLKATELKQDCYKEMFLGCSSLQAVQPNPSQQASHTWRIPELGTFTNTTTYDQENMFQNCLGYRPSDTMTGSEGMSNTYYTQNEPV